MFAKYPELKVVLLESGVTWLPAFLWRFRKFWRGVRTEVPWVDRSPGEIVRDHFRLTIQPLDAPDDPQRWNGPSNICVPMIYCCMRRTIRIGSSTATT